MKAQFKYAFRAGLSLRLPVFAVIFIMFLVFVALGSLGLLPFAAHVTAVSLGGTAIAVMMAFNIVGDVSIARRMFAAPGAYLYALTPVPRRQMLLSSVIAMAAMDVVTMAAVITGEVILSLNLAGGIGDIVWTSIIRASALDVLLGIWAAVCVTAGYLLIMMVILFCISARKSLLYNKPAGGLLTAALAAGIAFVINLSPFLLAPFGEISRFYVFFTITLGRVGSVLFVLLMLIEAAALFVLTSKLLERKVNI